MIVDRKVYRERYSTEERSDTFLFQRIAAHSSKQSPLTQRPKRDSFPPYPVTGLLSLLISVVPVSTTTKLPWMRERMRERGAIQIQALNVSHTKNKCPPFSFRTVLSTVIHDA